jgi:hypothetical protein
MHFHKNHEEKEDEHMLLLTLWPPGNQAPNISQISPWNSSSVPVANSASEPSDQIIAHSTAPPGVGSTSAQNQMMVAPGAGSHDLSQYWIPSPAEILVSTAQFSCTVCHRTFKRFNNMQVYIPSIN